MIRLLLMFVALTIGSCLINWWRTGLFLGTPLPRRYRRRDGQRPRWERQTGAVRIRQAEQLLQDICAAFRFHPRNRWQFAPEDRLSEIYAAVYPRWRFWAVADDMELERILMQLPATLNADENVLQRPLLELLPGGLLPESAAQQRV